ncbi:hypothetical protein ABZ722_33125 [Streptomyces longwoodensis]|uniref:hypothetical protein n=1 Tax=Streptomyces longwoodensis TaxID=68231 RepID=UPI0034074696
MYGWARPLAGLANDLLDAVFAPAATARAFAELSPGRRELLRALAELLTADDFQRVPFGSRPPVPGPTSCSCPRMTRKSS